MITLIRSSTAYSAVCRRAQELQTEIRERDWRETLPTGSPHMAWQGYYPEEILPLPASSGDTTLIRLQLSAEKKGPIHLYSSWEKGLVWK